jgi:hypothetical protein
MCDDPLRNPSNERKRSPAIYWRGMTTVIGVYDDDDELMTIAITTLPRSR